MTDLAKQVFDTACSMNAVRAKEVRGERRVVNGTWYEVCVSQGNEIRDVLVESSLHDVKKRMDTLAQQWPHCDTVFVRQHHTDPQHGEGASTFRVLHKLTLDFRERAK